MLSVLYMCVLLTGCVPHTCDMCTADRVCASVYCCFQGSWLLEHPRPLAANQVLLGPGSPRPPHTIEQPQVGPTGGVMSVDIASAARVVWRGVAGRGVVWRGGVGPGGRAWCGVKCVCARSQQIRLELRQERAGSGAGCNCPAGCQVC